MEMLAEVDRILAERPDARIIVAAEIFELEQYLKWTQKNQGVNLPGMMGIPPYRGAQIVRAMVPLRPTLGVGYAVKEKV
jgi:hypothetical protein